MDYLFLAWMVAYALLMLLFALWQRGTGIGGGNGFTGDSAVDVIIPHRNERDALPALLECLRLQEGAGSFRILLVDDHSEDGGGTLADAAAAQWEAGRLLSLHLGAGASGKKAALALGLQHSRAELVLFTDADVQLPPAWVAVYRQAFGAHPGVVLWCGPVRVGPGR
ncbi:MAG TPA: glycosyltransferase, partial [Bacteroidales bacterium]|nr:glycosyltransferase [Bacteroidales bacterium]